MNQKLQNLWTRTISALIFAAVVIIMIDLSRTTFNLLWVILGLLSLFEFCNLISKYGVKLGKYRNIWLVCGIIYILQAYLILTYCFENLFQDGSEAKRIFVLMLLTLTWANDVGAYLVGISIGKHKMCPSISPKKSWEGFYGGILFTIGAAFLWKIWCWDPVMVETWDVEADWLFFLLLGLVVALASVVGDLIESKFKRILEIKDSGNFMPGHGGVLDRMDSFMLTAPVTAIYTMIYFAL